MNMLNAVEPPGSETWVISPAGDSCLVLKFGQVLSTQANRLAARCARQLADAVSRGEVSGVTDIVPAMISVGVHYRPERVVCRGDEYPFEVIKAQLEAVLRKAASVEAGQTRRIEIPVCYGGEYGPDLEEVAASLKLTPKALVELHSSQWLDVLMLGFAPGHPYIGVLDEQLNPQRRASPRTRVEAGSIGLANRQSVIYPLELPGGWSLIGRTPLTMFDACRPEPCLLQSGDKIRFMPIEPARFESILRGERQP